MWGIRKAHWYTHGYSLLLLLLQILYLTSWCPQSSLMAALPSGTHLKVHSTIVASMGGGDCLGDRGQSQPLLARIQESWGKPSPLSLTFPTCNMGAGLTFGHLAEL